jgi:hypothetical protein
MPGWRLLRLLACVLLSLAAAGCQVQLVSNYDEVTDSLARTTQGKIDRQFQTWLRLPANSPALRYDDKSNRDFYADVSADLSVMESRAKAQRLNEVTLGLIANIRDSMDKTEARHREDQVLNPATLGLRQREIDFQFQQLIAFELAKKRGESPKS